GESGVGGGRLRDVVEGVEGRLAWGLCRLLLVGPPSPSRAALVHRVEPTRLAPVMQPDAIRPSRPVPRVQRIGRGRRLAAMVTAAAQARLGAAVGGRHPRRFASYPLFIRE